MFDEIIYNKLKVKTEKKLKEAFILEKNEQWSPAVADSVVKGILLDISEYLDSCGMTMPSPKYEYIDDETIESGRQTWKYLDGISSWNPKKESYSYKEILNPSFRFGDL